MSKPLSCGTVWTFPFITPLILGTNFLNIGGLIDAPVNAFYNFPEDHAHSGVNPVGFNSKDSLFLKRIRFNSDLSILNEINTLGSPLYISCPDTSLVLPTNKQLSVGQDNGFHPYEWIDVNTFIPVTQGANGVVKPAIWFLGCVLTYTATPLEVANFGGVVTIDAEWVHNLPLVMP